MNPVSPLWVHNRVCIVPDYRNLFLRGFLRRFGGGKVLQAGDMEDGAFGAMLGEALGVQFDANFDGARLDESHVVMGNVERLAI